MNKIATFGCVLLLLLSGCYLGDQVRANQAVSLKFPVPEGQNKANLSVSDTQVQEALNFIDGVLTSRGFSRDPNPPSANEHGLVAIYGKSNGTGLRSIGGPSVYFRGNRLDVIVVEGGNLNAPANTATKQLCNLLRKKLSNQYGADRVKLER